MRILLYLPNLTRACGGAEVYGLYIAKVLCSCHDVIIITLKPKDPGFRIGDIFRKYNVERLKTLYMDDIFESISKNKLNLFFSELYRNFAINLILKKTKADLFINGVQEKIINFNCRKSICIVHFPPKPYTTIPLTILNKKYVDSYNILVSNSHFGQYHLKRIYKRKSIVLTPPVIFPVINTSLLERKENIILAVDRLVSDKKIIEMIDAFKKLNIVCDTRYRMVIVGNKDLYKEPEYYNEILRSSKGYPIEIFSDVPFDELLEWYRKAKIFWHAKGYHVPDDDPENMEHFGMTTVEAMTNGCIPVVINKAGQKEIMSDGLEFLAWDELDQLIDITKNLIENENRIKELQTIVIETAKKYQYSVFKSRVKKIVRRFE